MGEVRRYSNHALVRPIHVLRKFELCAFRTVQSMDWAGNSWIVVQSVDPCFAHNIHVHVYRKLYSECINLTHWKGVWHFLTSFPRRCRHRCLLSTTQIWLFKMYCRDNVRSKSHGTLLRADVYSIFVGIFLTQSYKFYIYKNFKNNEILHYMYLLSLYSNNSSTHRQCTCTCMLTLCTFVHRLLRKHSQHFPNNTNHLWK